MLTLTQIYAEAWSLLDPDLADVIVTSLPAQREPDDDTVQPTGGRRATEGESPLTAGC